MFKDLRQQQLRSYEHQQSLEQMQVQLRKSIISASILNTIKSQPDHNQWYIHHYLLLDGFKSTDQYQELIKELAAEGYDIDEKAPFGMCVLSPDHPNNRLRQQQALPYQRPSVTNFGIYQASPTPYPQVVTYVTTSSPTFYKK